MSQLSTAPLTNPTIEVVNPNQQMLVKSAVQVVDFSFDKIENKLQETTMNIDRMTWEKLAAKNHLINKYAWKVDIIDTWIDLDIDFDYITNLMILGKEVHNYSKFTRILFSLKPTNNPFFQGLSLLTVRNLPSKNYLEELYNVDSTQLTNAWQFPKMYIQPNDSNELNFMIPINYPFAKFANSLSTGTPESARGEYFKNYVTCQINAKTISPLTTTGTINQLVYTLSAQIIDLELAGIEVK